MTLSPRAIIPIGCLFILSTIGQAQIYAPIPTRNGRPYSLAFLRFEPSGPLMDAGQSSLRLEFMAANSFTILPNSGTPLLQEDIEADIFRLNYQKMMKNGWQLGGIVTIEDLGPGFLDPTIDWYHRTILHLNNKRSKYAYGRHIVQVPGEPTFTGGFGLGDISLFASRSIDPITYFSLGLKIPTGNPNTLIGSGNFDTGVQVEHFVKVGRAFGLTLQIAGIAQGKATRLNGTNPFAYQLATALTWSANSKDRWTVQWQRESSALNSGVPVSDQIHATTSVGYQRQINHRQTLTLYFSEDLDILNPNFPNGSGIGPDFTIGASLTSRW